MRASTLLQYRGGGYDGCVWEWNFAYWDRQGKFHDVYSSGDNGLFKYKVTAYTRNCLTLVAIAERKAESLLASGDLEAEATVVTDTKALEAWCKATNPGLAMRVMLIVSGIEDEEQQVWCTHCGHACGCYNAQVPEGYYRGNGGIGLMFTELWCPECQENLQCSRCAELDKDVEAHEHRLCCDCDDKWRQVCKDDEIWRQLTEDIEAIDAQSQKYVDSGVSSAAVKRQSDSAAGIRTKLYAQLATRETELLETL